jgi:acyl-CoA thioester hydrolase
MVGEPVRKMEKYKFFLPLRVRYVETDMQGHVYFGHYLVYFDEATTEYMNAIGCTYRDLLAAGADTYYIHSECDYLSRSFFQDELQIHTRVGRIGNSSITFECSAFKAQTEDLVATGKIVAVCVNPETKKPVRVPEIFRQAVARYEENPT